MNDGLILFLTFIYLLGAYSAFAFLWRNIKSRSWCMAAKVTGFALVWPIGFVVFWILNRAHGDR